MRTVGHVQEAMMITHIENLIKFKFPHIVITDSYFSDKTGKIVVQIDPNTKYKQEDIQSFLDEFKESITTEKDA